MLVTKGPIALAYWGMSWGLVVLLESLRTAELPVALIILVQQGMSCGVEVPVERLLAVSNHRTRILERRLGS
jgi:hypothetical protein